MLPPRFALITSALILLVLALSALPPCSREAVDPPPPPGPPRGLAVVATWGDLLRQRPFLLEDGVTLRLGIGATRCPQWSAVLLYAYTEGFDDM